MSQEGHCHKEGLMETFIPWNYLVTSGWLHCEVCEKNIMLYSPSDKFSFYVSINIYNIWQPCTKLNKRTWTFYAQLAWYTSPVDEKWFGIRFMMKVWYSICKRKLPSSCALLLRGVWLSSLAGQPDYTNPTKGPWCCGIITLRGNSDIG